MHVSNEKGAPPLQRTREDFDTRPRILITGACGKLASTAMPFLEEKFQVFTTDRFENAPGLKNYRGADLTKFDQVQKVVQNFDSIVHFAIASRGEDCPQPENPNEPDPLDPVMIEVNALGTYHVLEAARIAKVKQIVYISSLTAYLGHSTREFYDELTPITPSNLYACTKVFGELLCQVYSRENGMSAVCLRVGQPFPLGGRLDAVWRYNRKARSYFVGLEDVVQGVLCALNTNVHYGVFNIVSSSDNHRFDIEHSKKIGYRPKLHFSETGVRQVNGLPHESNRFGLLTTAAV